ncbi:helix-turn-helix domain-containing protein [Ruminococcaceae bacterium OttesenSCG-928-L11]|nr:helix-turn-helix domain-containing protein [Ruminococcaceae bacterium OttesenSCG-928-L11]
MDLGERIKRLREEKGETHSEVAAVLKKSEGAVRSWEMRRSKPDTDTLISLANYFECSTDYLLGLSDVVNNSRKEKIENDIEHIFARLSTMTEFHASIATERILQYLNLLNDEHSPKAYKEDIFDVVSAAIDKIFGISDIVTYVKFRLGNSNQRTSSPEFARTAFYHYARNNIELSELIHDFLNMVLQELESTLQTNFATDVPQDGKVEEDSHAET